MLLVDVGPSVCCLSLGYISHTKQDRPIVTVEHYVEVNTADVFAALSLLHPGRYSGFKCWKICSDINMASCSTLASDRRCCQHGETVVTLWVLSAVCDHRNLLSVVLITPLVWHKNWTRGGLASYHSGDMLVTYCVIKTVSHLD